DAPPSKAQLGKAAVTWAAVSLADKLDTVVGLFAAGEKPTGSRDPYGLRRAAQGVTKIMVDGGRELFNEDMAPNLEGVVDRAFENYQGTLADGDPSWRTRLFEFFAERQTHVFERRGFRADETRAVARFWKRPNNALSRLRALSRERSSPDFVALAEVAK